MFIKKRSKLAFFLLGITSIFFSSLPVKSAEKLFLSYGPLKFSVEVKSLEIFAKDGTVNDDLGQYLGLIPPDKRDEFREGLTKKVPLNPVLVSRFFKSDMGEDILIRLGKGITLEGGENGGIALRGAIVQSAFDPDGLTLLNILKKYPTNLQIQGELVKGAVEEGDKIISATENLVKEMRTWTAEEASNNAPVDYAKLSDIRKTGKYQVKKEVWQLTDASRNRKFYVDVYIPQGVSGDKTSVIVFSHGLSSRPEDFDTPLNHLASYGYVIAAPQHIGSDTIYLKEMFEGYHKNIFDQDEFINRPKDISFVIDELERRNPTEFQGKLDLKNVGMAGHSFGGYTALAIAGATIDFDYLQKTCERLYGGLDVGILLQCRALELPRENYSFRDPRVTAIIAANPVNRYIFGQTGISKIQIPVLLASGSNDPAAPPVFEQGMPFTWLNTPDKYWMLVEGQAHVNFNKLDGGIKQALDSTVNLALPSQDLISSYVKGVSVAFFEVHLKNNPNFRNYLQSSYGQYLSENQEYKLDFITNASSDKVKTAIGQLEK
ncbi:alpha/beta hydrolase [Geminocystis sp. NIES-3709]|uniref:alpha/beta hydrolase n=1 Tax=Geminocystis sp. NIES-3709 TaxID=1617448 RepID=UPI0005FC63F4|nr:alpha/beta hydrolase [Geminocystis sp. NIES-3709]BAQ64110.1 probable lipoprotein signal peptide [Geminocystis sp. NIES-3709]